MAELDVTFAEAINNAARILRNAEMETDHLKVKDAYMMADVWVGMASVVADHGEDLV